MVNFKQIAEDCLTGKLSGTFVLHDGSEVKSSHLRRLPPTASIICSYGLYGWYISDNGNAYGDTGFLLESSIANFIPDMKREQITIDIPEGMEAVQETVDGEIRVRFVEKKLTYDNIINKLKKDNYVHKRDHDSCSITNVKFHKKVEVLRKLTNIRNYFGGDKPTNSWVITIDSALKPFVIKNPKPYREPCFIYFDSKVHAQAAIDMLGDELKYLFEPW